MEIEHEVRTRFTKYVFLDVVQFTYNRSVEAQSHIVEQLNKVVRDAISVYDLTSDDCILLPTGDGICIGIINSDIYDVHLRIGLTILELLNKYNESIADRMRQFQVRIAINQNVDNVVIDINGKENLAGTGINTAARLMNVAEPNQILVGQAVFDTLQQREKYMNRFATRNVKVKHDFDLTIYQYVGEGHEGLNINIPSLVRSSANSKMLSKQVAYYLAHALKNKQFILANQGRMGEKAEAMVILLWFLARDSFGEAEAPETNPYAPITYEAGKESLESQLSHYHSQDFWVKSQLARKIVETELSSYRSLLSPGSDSSFYYFVTPEGIEKLKREFPAIWQEFELST